MTASVRRRRTIIHDQKYPSPHMGMARYAPAREAIVRHLEAGGTDHEILIRAIQSLAAHPFQTEWQNEHRASCVLALNQFAATFSPDILSFGLEEAVVVKGRHNAVVGLKISGVDVSLRPDAYLQGVWKGADVLGILKLHFSKEHGLNIEAGQYASTLLHLYAEEHLAGPSIEASREHCLVIDVRHGRIHSAPSCFKIRRAEISAACEEIAQRWDSVKP